jgi:hypothetical protein
MLLVGLIELKQLVNRNNYLNQRQSKTVSGVTTYYVYDEQGNLLSER